MRRELKLREITALLPRVSFLEPFLQDLHLASTRDDTQRYAGREAFNVPDERIVPTQRLRPIGRQARAQLRDTLEKALELGIQVLEAYAREDLRTVARRLLQLGELYSHQDRWEDALACFKYALKASVQGGDSTVEILAPGRIGRMFRNTGRTRAALDYYRNCLSCALEFQDKEGIVLGHTGMGNVYLSRGQLDRAEACYRRGLEVALGLQDTRHQANLLFNLGIITRRRGQFQDSLRLLDSAIKLHTQAKNLPDLARAYNSLGLTLAAQGEWSAAEKAYAEAYRLSDETDVKANIHANRASMYLRQGRLPLAEEETFLAEEVFLNLKDRLGMAECLLLRGTLARMRHEAEGFALFEKAIQIARECHFRGLLGTIYLEYGRFRLEFFNREEAVRLFERAAKVFEKLKAREEVGQVEELLAQFKRSLQIVKA